ncbi:hypothetical protein BDV96DRAFT_688457 [Lophiotrema nucula]|uniref:F-box domain-containing protein n=1 Tax=Lophiotrema nucula TaxID=690887 RepID=A0A6A5Z7A5_9PLEO|nr:hypothetical protein BDV96DRAFT_688457 [Lophiotrema nucula]
MASLDYLISAYPILESLASSLSTLDLLNLGLTCKSNYLHVLSSAQLFKSLQRHCLCDGHGLLERQSLAGLYHVGRYNYIWRDERRIWEEEPVEVRLWNTKCDEAEALPCRKCGINICEECRYYPREPPELPRRRPHLNSSWELCNIMCLCSACDAKVEDELKGQFLYETCDCDIYTRWVCSKCVREERKWTSEYFAEHTKVDGFAGTKCMGDHQSTRDFWCICGKTVPDEARPRCTWCKRKHLPEDQWLREWDEIGSRMPDLDPCYPPFIGSRYNIMCEQLYPKLAYDGPIWQGSDIDSPRT